MGVVGSASGVQIEVRCVPHWKMVARMKAIIQMVVMRRRQEQRWWIGWVMKTRFQREKKLSLIRPRERISRSWRANWYFLAEGVVVMV